MDKFVDNLNLLIRELAKENNFKSDRIQVFCDDDGKMGIDIDGKDWRNCLTYYEAEEKIYCLFKGIELGKETSI